MSEQEETREFVGAALRSVGAEVRLEEPALLATLPEDGDGGLLADRLGAHELRLVFDPAQVAGGHELVVPGSRLLRQLDAFLGARASRSFVERPGNERLTLKRVRAEVRAARGLKLAVEDREHAAGFDVYLVYVLRYRSLERDDALETIHVRWRPGQPPVVDLALPADEVIEWPARPRKRVPDDAWAEVVAAADAAVAAHARARAEGQREAAQGRFQRDLGRLHAYYAGQIAEYQRRRRSDLSLLRIEELEEERELRVRELVRARRVHVEVEPLQALAVEIPLQRAALALQGRVEPAPRIPILFDRATGELTLPPCAACGAGLAGGVVEACDAGHGVHDGCLDRCRGCHAGTCAACEHAPCASCAAPLCPACGRDCAACGERTCADHAATCARCDAPACAQCLHPCVHCRARVCADDRLAASRGSEAFLCRGCAVACPGCDEATVAGELVRCGRCGRRFCKACHPRDASACVLCQGG